MALEGLYIEIAHSGTTSSTFLLTDIEDGTGRVNSRKRPGPVYVGPGETIELVYTTSVALSVELGVLRTMIDEGQVTILFVVGSELSVAIPTADLESVLTEGNTSGANDIEMTSGQAVHGEDAAAGTGGDLWLRWGEGLAADDGAIVVDDTGNDRGVHAIDLQATRGAATQVASGARSVILGGRNNTVSGDDSVVGGDGNTALGYGSVIFGYNNYASAYASQSIFGYNNEGTYYQTFTTGDSNVNNGWNSMIGGGRRNEIARSYNSAIIAGRDHYIGPTSGYNVILGGRSNRVYGYGNVVSGRGHIVHGIYNTAFTAFNAFDTTSSFNTAFGFGVDMGSDVYNSIGFCSGARIEGPTYYGTSWGFSTLLKAGADSSFATGAHGMTDMPVKWALGTDSPLSGDGAHQISNTAIAAYTTDNSASNMAADGAGPGGSVEFVVRADSSMSFEGMVLARQRGGSAGTVGDTASWFFSGTIKRIGAGTSIVNAVIGDGAPRDNDAAAAGWTLAISAVAGILRLQVTGETNKQIRWTGYLRTAESED